MEIKDLSDKIRLRYQNENPAPVGTTSDLPSLPGFYALHLLLESPTKIRVGKLGVFDLHAGVYVYLGSALGPGGLHARLGRHLRGEGNMHWHVDYLRKTVRVSAYFYQVMESVNPGTMLQQDGGANPLECVWSQDIISLPGAVVPIPGFGASDCRSGCPAHLVQLPPDMTEIGSYYLIDR